MADNEKRYKICLRCQSVLCSLEKAFCPKCGNKLELRYASRIINSKSPEATDYDFSVGDTFFVGDVEFRIGYFHCPNCQLDISFKEMKKYEEHKRI